MQQVPGRHRGDSKTTPKARLRGRRGRGEAVTDVMASPRPRTRSSNPVPSSGESGEPSVPRPSSLFWAKGFADATIAAVGRTAFKLVGEFVLGTPSLTENPCQR